MTKLEEHRQAWKGKSDEWLFERLANELKQKVEEIHKLLAEIEQLRTSNVVGQIEQLLPFCEWLFEKDFTCTMTSPEDWVKMYLKNNKIEMRKYDGHTLNYWKNNAEEDYIKAPISVLKYITCLEKHIKQSNVANINK